MIWKGFVPGAAIVTVGTIAVTSGGGGIAAAIVAAFLLVGIGQTATDPVKRSSAADYWSKEAAKTANILRRSMKMPEVVPVEERMKRQEELRSQEDASRRPLGTVDPEPQITQEQAYIAYVAFLTSNGLIDENRQLTQKARMWKETGGEFATTFLERIENENMSSTSDVTVERARLHQAQRISSTLMPPDLVAEPQIVSARPQEVQRIRPKPYEPPPPEDQR